MSDQQRRAVLFANGELPKPQLVLKQLTHDDFLVAVDGGLRYLTQLKLQPDLIIGDLDSVIETDLQPFRDQGIQLEKHPVAKDETDLEIALHAVKRQGFKDILVVAALGGRLDQTLANIFLLTQPELAEIDIRLIDGIREVFLIKDYAHITGREGERISLLPLQQSVTGIYTTGLEFPLNNETLFPYKSRGISNRLTDSHASIKVENGILLCIHETKELLNREVN